MYHLLRTEILTKHFTRVFSTLAAWMERLELMSHQIRILIMNLKDIPVQYRAFLSRLVKHY